MHRKAKGRRRAHRRKKPQRNVLALVAGGLGELMLTAGVIVLLFVLYTLWGTGIQTANAQDELRDELGISDSGGSSGGAGVGELEKEPVPLDELELGDAYGIIRIPRFGEDWEWIIIQGTKDEDLKNGPGHYPKSVNPGEVGNFSIAGHRSGHGEPFAQFPELRVGDIIEIETATGTFTYQLDNAPDGDQNGNKIGIKESWVVNPVPGESEDTEPTERRITLTTCWPRWGSDARMYATGVLIGGEEV